MKYILVGLLLAGATGSVPASEVGVSVQIGEPGFYGRIDIGNMPAPQLMYPQPIVVQPPPVVVAAPVYMRVPPGHARHWAKHCAEYRACGQPVYFVRDTWYRDVYAPRVRGHDRGDHDAHRHDRGRGHGD